MQRLREALGGEASSILGGHTLWEGIWKRFSLDVLAVLSHGEARGKEPGGSVPFSPGSHQRCSGWAYCCTTEEASPSMVPHLHSLLPLRSALLCCSVSSFILQFAHCQSCLFVRPAWNGPSRLYASDFPYSLPPYRCTMPASLRDLPSANTTVLLMGPEILI